METNLELKEKRRQLRQFFTKELGLKIDGVFSFANYNKQSMTFKFSIRRAGIPVGGGYLDNSVDTFLTEEEFKERVKAFCKEHSYTVSFDDGFLLGGHLIDWISAKIYL